MKEKELEIWRGNEKMEGLEIWRAERLQIWKGKRLEIWREGLDIWSWKGHEILREIWRAKKKGWRERRD